MTLILIINSENHYFINVGKIENFNVVDKKCYQVRNKRYIILEFKAYKLDFHHILPH